MKVFRCLLSLPFALLCTHTHARIRAATLFVGENVVCLFLNFNPLPWRRRSCTKAISTTCTHVCSSSHCCPQYPLTATMVFAWLFIIILIHRKILSTIESCCSHRCRIACARTVDSTQQCFHPYPKDVSECAGVFFSFFCHR